MTSGRIIGLDTSAGVAVGLAEAGVVVGRRWLDDSRRHAEALVPLLAQVVDEAGWHMTEVTGLAVGMGPGPFTGLRVGIAAAQTLSTAYHLPLRQVCSLDIVAREVVERLALGPETSIAATSERLPTTGPQVVAPVTGALAQQVVAPVTGALDETFPASDDEDTSGQFSVVLDARRREVYWARYDRWGQRLEGPQVSSPTDLPAALPVVGPAAGLVGRTLAWPSPERVDAGLLAAQSEFLPEVGSQPLYLRRPDATVPTGRKSVLVARPTR
ncbi:MAG: tRNA (adenosine(37)-N6)-threonylcarbamoyltransferase complex dimerization subunit type 1 TsaB [Propionibacteriaceae bacterium]|jgi:tRNA threonylcarbamoyl adenosine modification protein YeaZ|nr:tRNA (adenosine(37)-N6)-threonylcarbamoyltransferase complex dimerization subunit type 1 TsaB [Propionibacteriaceae bacterium]